MQTLALLITTCGASVHPHTVSEIIRVESKGNHLAINVNKLRRQPPPAATKEEAIATAKRYIAKGYSVDSGLMQISSPNLPALGISVEQVFDPCENIKAGAAILTDAYTRASKSRPDEQAALKEALSRYNTGSAEKGFLNGYVSRYYGANPPALPPQPPVEASQAPDQGDSYARQIQAVMQVDGRPEDDG